jgi:twitching motility two-component system response regulator PilG
MSGPAAERDRKGRIRQMAKTILVVDDSRTIRASLKAFVGPLGYNVIEAENGYLAIKAVSDARPDIIFADVMMPRLDGYKFCSVVKANAAYAKIPVVMLTSKDGMIDQARAQLARADDYMVKPFSKQDLGALLTKYIGAPPLAGGSAKAAS